jgi:hypothetical protein
MKINLIQYSTEKACCDIYHFKILLPEPGKLDGMLDNMGIVNTLV